MKLPVLIPQLWVLLSLLVIDVTARCYAQQEKPTIEWVVTDMAPFSIVKGPFKGTGHGTMVYNIAKKKLTDYHHTLQLVKSNSTQGVVKRHPNSCAYNLLKTPTRTQFMAFSKPIYWVLPIGVYSLNKDNILPLINDQGQVELSRLPNNRTFILGTMTGRSYGEKVDQQLKAYSYGQNVMSMSAVNLSSELFNMMKLKRINATLGYASEAYYLAKVNGLSTGQRPQDQVVYYPIAGQPQLFNGYISCSKSEFGLQVIKAVNQHFDDDDFKVIEQAYHKWIPENALPVYKRLLSEHH